MGGVCDWISVSSSGPFRKRLAVYHIVVTSDSIHETRVASYVQLCHVNGFKGIYGTDRLQRVELEMM